MAHRVESQPKIFHVQKLNVVPRNADEPPTQLICFPEEATEFAKFVGKKVRVRSVIELVETEE